MFVPRLAGLLVPAASLFALTTVLNVPAEAAPGGISVSAIATTIGFDGVTGLNATLTNTDGSPYDGSPVEVNFTSTCAEAGLAVLPASAMSVNGIASATYRPEGCAGLDQITAQVTGNAGLAASVSIFIASKTNLSAKGRLGRSMFFDTALSASGTMSCASCHAPAIGYADPGATPTPPGGISGTATGFRAAPSAAYALFIPRFKWVAAKPGATVGAHGTPRGGLMWDGRNATLSEQARGPFVQPHEMANSSTSEVQQRLLSRPYLAAFSKIYGAVTPASNPDQTVARMADAIATFERQDPSFRLLTSKYDRAQAGLTNLTPQEQRGQALFFDPLKGGCAGCHSSIGANQTKAHPQLFSDESYRAIAVPRNWSLIYNDDALAAPALAALGLSGLANGAAAGDPTHVYYDLGACGPFRTDSLLDPGLCGAFRVPSLRNVALRHSYDHNGVFTNLSQVVNFYIRRDAEPGQVYRTAAGTPDARYNDIPYRFQGNVQQRVPFRPFPDGTLRLSQGEVQDVVAFLCTLTDGYDPANPAAYAMPAQCRAAQHP